MASFLGETSVVHDPSDDPPISLPYRWQNRATHRFEQDLVTPWRVGHEMMQTLMHALYILRSQSCGERLDTLPFTGKQETRAVGSQRRSPIRVPCGSRQAIQIGRKAL
jgi:hypothetical protein